MSSSKPFNAKAFAERQLRLKRFPPSDETALTYKRFLLDLQKSKRKRKYAFPYEYRTERGLWRIRIIERFILHPDGENKGRPFILMDWQKFAIMQMYGWIDIRSKEKENPIPRFRESYIEIAKKNGKTTFIAILIICHLILDLSFSLPRAYCFATTEKQATICVDKVKEIVQASPALHKYFKFRQYNIVYNDEVNGVKRTGKIEALPGNIAKREGIEPSLAICDEYHHAKNNDIFATMKGSMVASEHAVMFIITTAGTNTAMPCYNYRQKCIDNMIQKKTNERAFYYIFTKDQKDNWKDTKKWYKANPTLSNRQRSSKPNSAILDAYNGIDLKDDRDVIRFRALHLSEWNDAGALSFISATNWKSLKYIPPKEDKKTLIEHICSIKDNTICTLGIDLSHVNDFTAISLLAKDLLNHVWLSKTYLITTKQRVEESEMDPNTIGLAKHVARDEVLTMGEELIDHVKIADFICDNLMDNLGLPIKHITYDRYGSIHLINTIKKRKPHMQDYIRAIPNNPWISFGQASNILKARTLRHEGNYVMEWMISNIRIKTDRSGHPIVNKEYNTEKIDGVMALIYAVNSTIELQEGLIQQGEKQLMEYRSKQAR